MQPDDESLLVDMLLSAREAKSITVGVSRDQFMQNRVLRLAIERLIQNIGEAATRLSPDARARLPHVPWHTVVGMRHRLVHDYPRVDLEKLWQVVDTDLNELIDTSAASCRLKSRHHAPLPLHHVGATPALNAVLQIRRFGSKTA